MKHINEKLNNSNYVTLSDVGVLYFKETYDIALSLDSRLTVKNSEGNSVTLVHEGKVFDVPYLILRDGSRYPDITISVMDDGNKTRT